MADATTGAAAAAAAAAAPAAQAGSSDWTAQRRAAAQLVTSVTRAEGRKYPITAAQLRVVHATNGRDALPELGLEKFDFLGRCCNSQEAHCIPHSTGVVPTLYKWLRAMGEMGERSEADVMAELCNIIRLHTDLHTAMDDLTGARFLLLPDLRSDTYAYEAHLERLAGSTGNWSLCSHDVLPIFLGDSGGAGASANSAATTLGPQHFRTFQPIVLPRQDYPDGNPATYSSLDLISFNFSSAAPLLNAARYCLTSIAAEYPAQYESLTTTTTTSSPGGLPRVQLALSPVLATLFANFQLRRRLATAAQWSPELQKWFDESEYFLQLVEGKCLTAWRELPRPSSLTQPRPQRSAAPRNPTKRTYTAPRYSLRSATLLAEANTAPSSPPPSSPTGPAPPAAAATAAEPQRQQDDVEWQNDDDSDSVGSTSLSSSTPSEPSFGTNVSDGKPMPMLAEYPIGFNANERAHWDALTAALPPRCSESYTELRRCNVEAFFKLLSAQAARAAEAEALAADVRVQRELQELDESMFAPAAAH